MARTTRRPSPGCCSGTTSLSTAPPRPLTSWNQGIPLTSRPSSRLAEAQVTRPASSVTAKLANRSALLTSALRNVEQAPGSRWSSGRVAMPSSATRACDRRSVW
jgi:hypothetical protein